MVLGNLESPPDTPRNLPWNIPWTDASSVIARWTLATTHGYKEIFFEIDLPTLMERPVSFLCTHKPVAAARSHVRSFDYGLTFGLTDATAVFLSSLVSLAGLMAASMHRAHGETSAFLLYVRCACA
jgi:hypothetical protein